MRPDKPNQINAGGPRAAADALACLEVAVPPFSLWRLLNQPQSPDDRSVPPQQPLSVGDDIGQSLIDMWNRAAQARSDGSGTQLVNAVDYPDGVPGSRVFGNPQNVGGLRPFEQLMPYLQNDSSGDDSSSLVTPLAARYLPADPNDPRSETAGWSDQPPDPNIQSVQWQSSDRNAPAELGLPLLLGALAAWMSSRKSPSSPPPAGVPDSVGSPPDQPADGVGRPTSSETSPAVPSQATPDMPGLAIADPSSATSSAAAQLPSPVDALLWQRNHPMYDPDSLPEYVPGDFSRGAHDIITNYEIDALRKMIGISTSA